MEKKVIIVTGFDSQKKNIKNTIQNLCIDGYTCIRLGMNGEHPNDVSNTAFDLIKSISQDKIVVETNNDAAINALKVMRFKKEISDLKVIHYNDEGNYTFGVECDDHGIEWEEYPLGFLDEWSKLMGQTV